MITQRGISGNGTHNGVNGATIHQGHATSTQPKPHGDWRNTLAPFTHSLTWVDGDGCSNRLTIRADTLEQLLSDLKLVKYGIRVAKFRVAETSRRVNSEPGEPAPQSDVLHCHIHGIDMARRWSKRNNGHYFLHKLPIGDFCYGRKR